MLALRFPSPAGTVPPPDVDETAVAPVTIGVLAPDADGFRAVQAALDQAARGLRVVPLDPHGEPGPGVRCVITWVPEGADHEALLVQLRAAGNRPLILLVDRDDAAAGMRAVYAGAQDFLLRPFRRRELIAAVERALGRAPDEDAPEPPGVRAAFEGLTEREREVLALMLEGECNQGIADCLGIAPKTVAIHVSRLLDKTRSPTLAALARRMRRLEATSA